ncbi:Zinc finger and BTB domain-containing protein 32 [Fukomys damarensis]|uniref:Zinc finger and BTB domain-containing protein 32 n=1 Tax=Fukomys damarensis TaxID=885580 RepID=A0A091DD17_FUKDA|nr:Zinc finger and BTB domain-containing protein 32 [Fukomys damarensis]
MPLSPTRLLSPYGSDRLVRLAASLRPALCDTLITVEGQEFPAHSLVLAGVSQQLGCRGQWVLVEGISHSTFAQLLSFVYGESVDLQPGDLGPLEEAARALGVQALEEACRKARRDKTEEKLDPGLKKHQEEPEEPTRDSERGLGSLGKKQNPAKFFRLGGREQKLHKHKAPRESPEMTGATQEFQREMRSKKEKLSQIPVSHREADGKQGVVLRVIESPGSSEESLRAFPGPLPLPGSLQTRIIPSPWWAEAPWLGEGQPSLWSILLWPPRYGAPFPHSTPNTGAWQEVWPQDQRISLTLNHPKGLWSQNQLVSSSPSLGSHPQVPLQLSPGEIEESGQATGEKPFSCTLCPQRSRDFSAMTKHLRTHGAAPYRCPLCRAGCPSLSSMQAHMRGHSPSQLPPGWTISSTFLYSSSKKSRAVSSLAPSSSTT